MGVLVYFCATSVFSVSLWRAFSEVVHHRDTENTEGHREVIPFPLLNCSAYNSCSNLSRSTTTNNRHRFSEMDPSPPTRRALEWWQWLLCAAGAGLIAFFALGLVEHHGIRAGWAIAAVAGLAAVIFTGIGFIRLIKRTFEWWQWLLCATGAGLLALMGLALVEYHPNPIG